MIAHYLKVAVRQLMKYPVQNFVSIVGLAVCLFCFGISLYICRFVMSADECFPHRERIAEIAMKRPHDKDDFSGIPVELVGRMRGIGWTEAEAFTYVAFPDDRSFCIEVKPDEMLPFDPLRCMEVDTCFRQVFGLDIVAGSWQTAARTPNAVILSESEARRIYGDRVGDAVGKRLVTTAKLPFSSRKGGVAYTVQAVMDDIPANNSLTDMEPVAALVLNDTDGRLQWQGKDVTGGNGYALLKGGSGSREKLEADIRDRGLRQSMFGEEYEVRIYPLGYSYWKYGGARFVAWITSVTGVLVLLVGLLNFFYFQIGAFLNRSREYSLRRVFGGSGRHLAAQLFTQAALTVAIAFLMVFVLVELFAPMMRFSVMDFHVSVDPSVLQWQCVQYLLLVLVFSFLACLLTVRRASRTLIQTGIRGTASGSGRHRVRNVMLGIQYFVCWIFISLAAALYLQADKTTSALFGTLDKREKAGILSVSLDYPFLEQAGKLALVERMRQIPGVEDCLLADIAFTRGVSGNVLCSQPPSQPDGDKEYAVNILAVPRNFFSFMNMPVVQGRIPDGDGGMVVDRTFGQDLRERDGTVPLGAVFYDNAGRYTVTGVCEPLVAHAYHVSSYPGYYGGYAFILSDFRQYVGHCYLKCGKGQADEVRRRVEALLKQTFPYTVEPQVTTFLDDIEKEQGIESMLKGIVLFLAVVCVVITLLGVYAAITLDTERRRKEVAVRKVNGAGVGQIMWLFARTYVWIGGVAAVLAFPLVYALLSLWRRLYSIFFHYGFVFWACVLLSVAVVTALTVVFRIVRIARVNPAEVIKSE